MTDGFPIDSDGSVSPDAQWPSGAEDRPTESIDGPAHRFAPFGPKERARTLIAAAVAAAVCILLVGLSVFNAPRLSLLDEATHIDYTFKAARGDLVRTGESLDPYVLQSWSCRHQVGQALPPCDAPGAPGDYPSQGIQYNAKHPPTYYAVTGWAARALAAISGDDFITTARFLGAGWLFLAVFGLYLVLRSWSLGMGYALGAAVSLSTIPMVLHASSTVTNDAAAACSGVAALFVLGRVVHGGNVGVVIPLIAAAVAASTKVINVAAFGAVAVVLLVVAAQDARRARPAAFRLVGVAAAIAIGVAVVFVGWGLVQDSRAIPGYTSPLAGASSHPIDGLAFDDWLPSLGLRVPGGSYYVDPAVDSAFLAFWGSVVSALAFAAGFLALVVGRRRSLVRNVGLAVLLGSVVYPLMVQLQAYVNTDRFVPFPATRYGMSLLPMIIAALALVFAQRQWRAFPLALVGCGLVATLVSVTGLAGPWLA